MDLEDIKQKLISEFGEKSEEANAHPSPEGNPPH